MQTSDRILFLVTLYFPAKRVESQPAATGQRHDLHFSMMRKFVQRSTLSEFDMSPMEKKQEKLRL